MTGQVRDFKRLEGGEAMKLDDSSDSQKAETTLMDIMRCMGMLAREQPRPVVVVQRVTLEHIIPKDGADYLAAWFHLEGGKR